MSRSNNDLGGSHRYAEPQPLDTEWPRTWRDWWPSVLTRDYWAYLLRTPDDLYYGANGWFSAWANLLWCRFRNHPDGPVFYNVGGLEPDPRCRNCGDEIA